jgi:hypothetical protein
MGLFSRFCVWALKCPGKAGSEQDPEREQYPLKIPSGSPSKLMLALI